MTAKTRSEFTPSQLAERTTYRRAVEAAIWGMPLVASDAIRQGFLRGLKARYNDIVYFSKPADWKFQTTTPNASTYYFYSAFSTKDDGPIVLDVPAAIGAGVYGQVCDMWDVPVVVIGPGGKDQGKGGKYLLLPPGYRGDVPVDYFAVPLQTYGGFWLTRAIPKTTSQSDVDAAIALIKKFRMYPLSGTGNPPDQHFIDVHGKLWDGVPRMDESFYAVLAKLVNEEPTIPRDLAVMNMLRSIGIEKGKDFNPPKATAAILKEAISEAKAWMVNQLHVLITPYWKSARWSLPDVSAQKTQFSYESAEMLDYDNRGTANFYAWAPPMKQDASAPSIYLLGFEDGSHQPLSGDKTYRLRVPPNVPAKQYWSVTVYDMDTSCFIREAPVISLDSYNQKTKKNSDGSIDIYFAPRAPAGQENNWVTTPKGGMWSAIFRLYAPDQPFFDKTWQLPDFKQVTAGESEIAA